MCLTDEDSINYFQLKKHNEIDLKAMRFAIFTFLHLNMQFRK